MPTQLPAPRPDDELDAGGSLRDRLVADEDAARLVLAWLDARYPGCVARAVASLGLDLPE